MLCKNARVDVSALCVEKTQDVNILKNPGAADAVAVGVKSIHQQGWPKCWCVTEMADKPVCFALGVAVVKGDQCAAVFRGSQVPLGRRGDRSPTWPAANALTRPSTIYIILH